MKITQTTLSMNEEHIDSLKQTSKGTLASANAGSKQFLTRLALCILPQPSSPLTPFSDRIPQYSGKVEASGSRPVFYPLNNPLQKDFLFFQHDF